MPITIKEIEVKTIITQGEAPRGLSEQQLVRLKRELLLEVRGWIENEKKKERER